MEPVVRHGATIDKAISATEAYRVLSRATHYGLIIVDLIVPLSLEDGDPPPIVETWDRYELPGVGLVEWLMNEVRPACPVIVLSITREPASRYGLDRFGIAAFIDKATATPQSMAEKLRELLEPRVR
jgi:DNA-binding NarL/FixJ family response regulator